MANCPKEKTGLLSCVLGWPPHSPENAQPTATQHEVGHQASDFVGTELEVGWDKLEGAAALRRQHRAQPVGAFSF